MDRRETSAPFSNNYFTLLCAITTRLKVSDLQAQLSQHSNSIAYNFLANSINTENFTDSILRTVLSIIKTKTT